MSALILKDLRVRGRAGCTEPERAFPQTFTFDLRIEFDAREAVAKDDVRYAPDYERIAATVRELLAEQEWHLLERMAFEVGRALLATSPSARLVQVVVSKDILENASRVSAALSVDREGLVES
jgi:FolB domain-containing protein